MKLLEVTFDIFLQGSLGKALN